MRILRLRAYYDPEKTAGIHLDHDLCEAFSKNKIHYISYTPTPTRGVSDEIRKKYSRRKKEVKYGGYVIIKRFSMFREGKNPIFRLLRYIACSIEEYFLAVNEKAIDIVYSSSTPPTQGALSALVAKRLSKKYGHKVPFIYNLQDVFPDSLVNAKMTKKDSVIWKIGRKIEDFTYKNADKIIVISDGFKRNIMKKGVPENKITVISNWVDLDKVKPVNKEDNILFEKLNVDRSKYVVVYAGNLGQAQGADVLVDAAKMLIPFDDIQFVIFGGGSEYSRIINRINNEKVNNALITPLQPLELVSEVYSMGDIALITCKPGTGNAGMPSKVWSIMACDTPIIASFDTQSDLANVINESSAGYCVTPGDPKLLSEAILETYKKWKKGQGYNANIREYALNSASREVCVQKYIDNIINVNKKWEEMKCLYLQGKH